MQHCCNRWLIRKILVRPLPIHPPAKQVVSMALPSSYTPAGVFNSLGLTITVVPYHKEMAPGTLLNIIRKSGIDKETFLKMLEEI